jgi:chromosome segregation ATPase
MNEHQLRAAMDKLRAELDQLDEMDAPIRARLSALVGEIEATAHEVRKDRNLIQRLEDEIATLEVTHPSLTIALNDLLGSLTAAGI